MKDAFDKAKKENGREAVNPREQASQTFSLLTTVGHRLKYSLPSVNIVQTGGTMVSKQMVSIEVSTEQQHSTGKVTAMVTAKNMVSTAMVSSKVSTVSSPVSIKSMVANLMVNSKVNTETPEFARTRHARNAA